jgi:hypothetical protein
MPANWRVWEQARPLWSACACCDMVEAAECLYRRRFLAMGTELTDAGDGTPFRRYWCYFP